MTIDVLQLAAIIAACTTIGSVIWCVFKFVERNKEQDRLLNCIQMEQRMVIQSLLTLMSAFEQIDATGNIAKERSYLEQHLNKSAHSGDCS